MKFNNFVAYCKGWYQTNGGGVPEMWKDMSVCIQVDGWMCYSKNDVARWCMSRMEDIIKELPQKAWKLSFSRFFGEMENNRSIWNFNPINKGEISDADLIIWTFRNFVAHDLESDCFDEWVKPSDDVLPLSHNDDGLFDKKFGELPDQTGVEPYESRKNKLR